MGPTDPLTLSARRRLSSLMFSYLISADARGAPAGTPSTVTEPEAITCTPTVGC